MPGQLNEYRKLRITGTNQLTFCTLIASLSVNNCSCVVSTRRTHNSTTRVQSWSGSSAYQAVHPPGSINWQKLVKPLNYKGEALKEDFGFPRLAVGSCNLERELSYVGFLRFRMGALR